MQTQKLDLWAIVELFGHSRIAGQISEYNIAGANMVRVDVPETTSQPAFTRFFNPTAIYAINPVDEDTARFTADQLNLRPIMAYDVREMIRKNEQLRLSLTTGQPDLRIRDEEEEEE